MEYYLPLFFEETATLFDYLPESTLAVRIEGADAALEEDWRQIHERFEQRRHDIANGPLLEPAGAVPGPGRIRARLKATARSPRHGHWPGARRMRSAMRLRRRCPIWAATATAASRLPG
ncbi:MAG: hypothetical protein U5L11_06515 [Arhodomonas sp.]|nr:hypothetical protein [Arhodomonas sp.]